MIKKIKQTVFAFRLKRAISKANQWHALTRQTYMVMMLKGRPKVYAKKDLKALYRKRVLFGTWQQLQGKAIYIT